MRNVSLDISFCNKVGTELYWRNITHNLNKMAEAAGIYDVLWHPEDANIKYAEDMIPIIEGGLKKLKENPEQFKPYSAKNGWGTYEQFVPWLEEFLDGCRAYPDGLVEVSR
jgi:hypothetical protein